MSSRHRWNQFDAVTSLPLDNAASAKSTMQRCHIAVATSYSRGFANVGLRYIKAGAVDFAIFGRGSGSYEDISHASLVELGR
jgi:hypothetical protein